MHIIRQLAVKRTSEKEHLEAGSLSAQSDRIKAGRRMVLTRHASLPPTTAPDRPQTHARVCRL
jgi:hypothetical protein